MSSFNRVCSEIDIVCHGQLVCPWPQRLAVVDTAAKGTRPPETFILRIYRRLDQEPDAILGIKNLKESSS